jgi:hypothetical protein
LDSLTGLSEFSGEPSGAHIKSIGLIAADTSEDRYVAEAALKTLGTLDDIRAARELALLAAKGGALGQAAFLELGQSLASLQGIAPQLIELYQDSNSQTRSELLPRLTELKDPTAIGLVSQALLAPHVSPSTKENIIKKVLDSSPDHAEKFLPILGKLLYSSSAPEVRLEALKAITRIARHFGLKSSQAIISPLREVADSPDDPLQPNARIAVARIDDKPELLVSTGEAPSIDTPLRVEALDHLTTPSASTIPPLRKLAQDLKAPFEVRIAAANALGRSHSGGPEEGANLITEMLKEPLSGEARIDGLRALLGLSPTKGIEQLRAALDRGTITPDEAAASLSGLDSPQNTSITTPVYLELLRKIGPTSPFASSIIHKLGDSKEPSVIPSLQAFLRASENGTSNDENLLAALVRLGDKNAVDELVSNLTWTTDDSEFFLQSLAVSPQPHAAAALASQLQTDTPSRTSRFLVLENLPHPEKVAFGERLIAAAETERDPQKSLFFKSYGKAIVTATTELGIKSPFRYPPEFLISAVRERLSPTLDGRPLATVITAREDHNGAFNTKAENFTALHQAGYRVMLYEVATDKQAVLALQMAAAQGQKADLIMFYGHGSQRSLAFGAPDPRLSRSDSSTSNDPGELTVADEVLLREASYTLRPGGEIIAVSCSLGEGGRGADNIASLLRRVFPQAKKGGIYTNTDDSTWQKIKFTPSGTHVRSSVDVLQSTRPTSADEERPA